MCLKFVHCLYNVAKKQAQIKFNLNNILLISLNGKTYMSGQSNIV